MTVAEVRSSASAVRPGPVFWLVVGVFVFGLWAAATRAIRGDYAVFILVAAGWVLSLIFHEFAHAFVAWQSGDTSIPERGYLTLDPRAYTNPMLSFGFPLLLVVMGGIGLPGGMVQVNLGAVPSKWARSAVSLAGPATNVVFGLACALPVVAGWVDDYPILLRGLSFLAFLQVTAVILNMLPLPGLDGFGAIRPFLPPVVLRVVGPLAPYSLMMLFVVLWTVPAAQNVFWTTVVSAVERIGIDRQMVSDGFSLFQFWQAT